MVEHEDLARKHQICADLYLAGYSKRAAMTKAGYAKSTNVGEIFDRPDVWSYVRQEQEKSRLQHGMTKDFLLEKLKMIIECDPGELIELDEKGNASINFERMSPGLRKMIRKVSIDSNKPGGKYKRKHTKVSIDVPDIIAAIKEAGILLGFRQENLKIEGEMDLVKRLEAGLPQANKEET